MASDERPSLSKIWLLAIRPQTLPASVTPVIVGCALAHADGARNHGEAFLFWLFALAIQIGTNLHNDYADFVRGADTKVGVVSVRGCGHARLWTTSIIFPRLPARGRAL